MKKIISTSLIAICLTFCLHDMAFASTLSPELDYQRIAETDRYEIEQLINSDRVMDIVNPGSKPDRDLQWATPYKRYVDTDIFSMDSSAKSDIMTILEAGSYCYEITVFKDGLELVLTFAKGNPPKEGVEDILTEEEYQEVLNNAGKWMLNSDGYVEETDMSYYKAIQKYGLTSENDFVIVASQPGLEYPVIVEFVDGVAEYIYPIYGLRDYPIFADENNRANLTKYENGSYSYSEVAALSKEYKQSLAQENYSMPDNKAVMIIVIIVIAVILVPTVPYLIRKRDFKRQIEGKKPERKIKVDEKIPYYNKEDLRPKSERDTADNVRRPPF